MSQLTKEQIDKTCDREINQELEAMILGFPWNEFSEPADNGNFLVLHSATGEPSFQTVHDYCGGCAELMTLAADRISLIQKNKDGSWRVESNPIDGGCYCYSHTDKNLFRAIACTMLLIGK